MLLMLGLIYLGTPIRFACLVILTAVPTVQQHNVPCQFGWVLFNGACYGFLQERMSWLNGMITCEIYGGHLVEIQSKKENAWLIQQFKKHGYDSIWLGGSDQFIEGTWYWVASRRIVGPFRNWNSPQPDNHMNGEHCMDAAKNRLYKWNDNFCTTLQHVVCERNLPRFAAR